MKKTLLYLLSVFVISSFHLSAQTLTQKLYLDFGKSDGTNGNLTTGADANGNYWNNIVSEESGSPSTKPAGYTVNLINSGNQNTDFVLETTEAFRANGRNNGALLTPNPDLLGDLAVATATEDYFFIENSQNDKGAFVFKNLDPTKAYKFYVFGSRSENGVRTSVFSISGVNGSHGTHQTSGSGIGTDISNTNDNNIFRSGYVVPKANGEILFETGILTGGFAYINAMKMEEYSDYELPAAEKKFYIDFGKNNNGTDGKPTENPDTNGNYWNNMYSNGDGPTTEPAGKSLDILYSDNSASTYTLETATAFEFNGVRNGGLTNPDPELLGDFAIATATHDYLFLNGDNKSGTLNFKNLDTNKMYRFNIFGSRLATADPGNRIGFVTLTGSTSVTGIHQMGGKDMCGAGVNQNTKNIFVSEPLVPGSEGLITLTITEWLGDFVHINAIKIEELNADEDNRATALTISGNNITSCGKTTQLSVTTTPADAFCPPVVWSIDNPEIAQITTGGKLYPLQNGTVTVTATATFDNETSISDSKQITISNQDTGDYSLAIMGSSVPNGTGAEAGKGYAHLLASWLAENAENPWNTTNISIGGNSTTDVMNRWDADLLPTCSKYVYYGLSLGNEGIHERGEAAFNSYRDNMLILIERARSFGKIPLVGNNYPRGDFNATDYNYVKQLNLLMHQWDVPSVNLLGAIDNGAGRWASGYIADNAHPNTAGHAEMFYVFVPSLFDAIASGKPQPVRIENTSVSLDKADKKVKRISWTPENVLHSFTLSFSFKTTSTGTIASFENKAEDTFSLKINPEGKLVYETPSTVSKLTSSASVNDGEWHQLSLTHYYAWGRTQLYVDGVQVTGSTIIEKLVPVSFYLNDFEEAPESVEFRELYFHRAGMNADEIQALQSGKMLKSSLEIYALLNDKAATTEEMLENSAQSLNELTIEEKTIEDGSSLKEITYNLFQENGFKEISIYNIAGNRLLRTDAPLKSFEGLSVGVYIAKIVDKSNDIITQKIIVE